MNLAARDQVVGLAAHFVSTRYHDFHAKNRDGSDRRYPVRSLPMAKILTMHGKADDPLNQDELARAQFRTAEKGFLAPIPKAGFLAPGQIVSVILADGEAFGYVNHDTDETFQLIIPTGAEKSLLKSILIVLALIVGGGWIGGQIGGGEAGRSSQLE